MMKDDKEKIDAFLQDEGLLDTIDEQCLFAAIQSQGKNRQSKRSNKRVVLLLASLLLLILAGFTTIPYFSHMIDHYFGGDVSPLLKGEETISVIEKETTIRLHHYFQDNDIYYSIISIEGAQQPVAIDSIDAPGVSMIKEITPKDTQDKQFFVCMSFAKLSALTIKSLQIAPLMIDEEIKINQGNDDVATPFTQIPRSASISSHGMEETTKELLILDGEPVETNGYFTIQSYGLVQNQFHVQLRSPHRSMDTLLLSINEGMDSGDQPTMTYLFPQYEGNKRAYGKEFVFDVASSDQVEQIHIAGTIYTDEIVGEWTFALKDPMPLPVKVFESTDQAVTITVSPLSVQIQTPNVMRLKGASIMGEDKDGHTQELATIDSQDQQNTNDMTYMTFYNDLDSIEKIHIGKETFYSAK